VKPKTILQIYLCHVSTLSNPGFVLHELPLLKLQALLARANGDEAGYRKYANDYGALANSIDFQAHMA
jgi:adenylate cyclase